MTKCSFDQDSVAGEVASIMESCVLCVLEHIWTGQVRFVSSSPWMRNGLRKGKAVALLGILLAIGISASGQSSPPASPATPAASPAYEVVSIKPSKSECVGMSYNSPPGRLEVRCVTLGSLVYSAYMFNPYGIGPRGDPQGLPGWAKSARFDVDAKMDDVTAETMTTLNQEERGKLRQRMLRALLADRFKLQVHTETKERPVYELVVAHGGAKLKPWPAGVEARGSMRAESLIRMEGWPVEQLAFSLSDSLDRPVVDKTGLTGKYDIALKWTPDDQQGRPDAGPTIFAAIQEQLGLKLVPARGPVDTLVVDHAEQPAEN